MSDKAVTKARAKYRECVDYLEQLTVDDAARLARHGNPSIRDHVAPMVALMAQRHANGEFCQPKDEQTCDDIMYYADVAIIRKALGSVDAA